MIGTCKRAFHFLLPAGILASVITWNSLQTKFQYNRWCNNDDTTLASAQRLVPGSCTILTASCSGQYYDENPA